MVNHEAMKPQAAVAGPDEDATLALADLDPGHCVFRHVSKLSRAVAAAYDQGLASSGLTAQQFNVMMTLHRSGPCLVGALAKLVGMHGSSVPRAIAPLAARGWVSASLGEDRRSRVLALTPAGEIRLAEALPAWRATQRAMLGRIGADPWKSLTAEFKIVVEAAKSISRDS